MARDPSEIGGPPQPRPAQSKPGDTGADRAPPDRLRPAPGGSIARIYVRFGARAISLALGAVGVFGALILAAALAWFSEPEVVPESRRDPLAVELHRRTVDRISRQLESLRTQTRRLREVDMAALRSGLLENGDPGAIAHFFWGQLETFPEAGYVGLLRLEDPLSGIAVRRRPEGDLRVESVAFQPPRSPAELFPARRRQFFRLGPAGRAVGRIVEHDFNAPWEAGLEAALREGRKRGRPDFDLHDFDWRGVFNWAVGETVSGLEVEPFVDEQGRASALLGAAPAFDRLELPPPAETGVDVWVLDLEGRVLAGAESGSPPADLRRRLGDLGDARPRTLSLDLPVPSALRAGAMRLSPWPTGDEGGAAVWIATQGARE